MRSLLQLRWKPHHDPERAGEHIVEVVRGEETVATIYGTREGIQICSSRLPGNSPPFGFRAHDMPSLIVPLLKPGEVCPWCQGMGSLDDSGFACPVCKRKVQ
jgi:hypothetical protein